jgi:hypothetical protein
MEKEINSKKIFLSILISLMVLQLSVPVYAPHYTSFGRLVQMPLEPVADLSLTYENVVVRSITGSGFGGVVQEPNEKSIVIDIISYGVVSIGLQPDDVIDALFIQKMSLNFQDDAANSEAVIRGKSDLAINTPAGILLFNGQLQGIASVDPGGPYEGVIFWMEFIGLSSSKSSVFDDSSGSESFASNPVVISLLIQGTLTRTGTTPDGKYPTFDLTLEETTGTVLQLIQGRYTDQNVDVPIS